MRFDAIVVPRGAEARAVQEGWPVPRPALLVVAAGASAAEQLSRTAPLATALVLGLCGAIDPALRVGDAVVYARVSEGSESIELDAGLAAACALAGGCATVGAVTVARVVGDAVTKSALREASGAAVIDMEASAIARALHRRGVRVAMVRVVSDDAVGDLPDLRDVYDGRGALRPLALARALSRTPVRGVRFIVNALHALRILRATATRIALTADD